jgi:hypothetical protein
MSTVRKDYKNMAHDHRFSRSIHACLTIVGVRKTTYSTVDTKMPLFTASGYIPDDNLLEKWTSNLKKRPWVSY